VEKTATDDAPTEQPQISQQTTSHAFGTPSLLGVGVFPSTPTSTVTVFGGRTSTTCTRNFKSLSDAIKRKRKQEDLPSVLPTSTPAAQATPAPAAQATPTPYTIITSEAVFEDKLAFCCYHCRCHPFAASMVSKTFLKKILNRFYHRPLYLSCRLFQIFHGLQELCSEICDSPTEPGDYMPFYSHRRCCHDNQANVEGVRKAIERTLSSKKEKERVLVPKSVLQQKSEQSKKEESRLQTETQDAGKKDNFLF
jgi:hypothetical protein